MEIKRLITLMAGGMFLLAGCAGMHEKKMPAHESAAPAVEETAEPAAEPAMEEAADPAPEAEEEMAEPEMGDDPGD